MCSSSTGQQLHGRRESVFLCKLYVYILSGGRGIVFGLSVLNRVYLYKVCPSLMEYGCTNAKKIGLQSKHVSCTN